MGIRAATCNFQPTAIEGREREREREKEKEKKEIKEVGQLSIWIRWKLRNNGTSAVVRSALSRYPTRNRSENDPLARTFSTNVGQKRGERSNSSYGGAVRDETKR